MSDTDPYRHAVTRLRAVYESRKHDAELTRLIEARDEVHARYRPFFSAAAVTNVSAEDFRDFLMFRNNRHWTGLQRLGPRITHDVPALRQALVELLDESVPVSTRLDRLLPQGRATVKKLGKAVLTPILMIAYPDRYGVWNGTSEGAMRELGIWPADARTLSTGRQYERVNALLLELTRDVGVDLWTLDALWWRIGPAPPEPDETEEPAASEEPPRPAVQPAYVQFGLERHLHDFLLDNWANTALGKEWNLCEEGGDIAGYGSERPTPIGKIDLLAKHKREPRWLVVELKRAQSSDDTVGQVMRYMGWVKSEVAAADEAVEGLIIAQAQEDKLRYALKVATGIRFMRYKIDFELLGDSS